MFKKILLPTDGSPAARASAEVVASQIQAGDDVHVTVVLVIQPLNSDESDFDDEVVERHNAKMREKAQAALKLTSGVFEARGISCSTKVLEGDPVSTAIAEEATSGGYDVIVMGSRGLGMSKTDLHYLGSVTEHVIRRVGMPVLVVPA